MGGGGGGAAAATAAAGRLERRCFTRIAGPSRRRKGRRIRPQPGGLGNLLKPERGRDLEQDPLVLWEGRGEGCCCSSFCRCSCGRNSDGLQRACTFSRQDSESSSCTIAWSALRCCTSAISSSSPSPSWPCSDEAAAALMPGRGTPGAGWPSSLPLQTYHVPGSLTAFNIAF